MLHARRPCAAALAAALLPTSFADADDFTYIAFGGPWVQSSAWVNADGANGVPGDLDRAIFDHSGARFVSLFSSTPYDVHNIWMRNGTTRIGMPPAVLQLGGADVPSPALIIAESAGSHATFFLDPLFDVTGGILHTPSMSIGRDAFATGELNYNTQKSEVKASIAAVGERGTGTVIVNHEDARFEVHRLFIGEYDGAVGEVNVALGELDVTDFLELGAAGTGRLDLHSGATAMIERLILAAEPTGNAQFLLDNADATIATDLEMTSAGSATVLVENGATLDIAQHLIGAPAVGAVTVAVCDPKAPTAVTVGGDLIGARVRGQLAPGCAPQIGDVHTLVAVGGEIIDIMTVAPAPNGGQRFHMDARDGAVTMLVTHRADLDGSLDIGFGDLLVLLTSWGPCPKDGTGCDADLDGDGMVGMSDLRLMILEQIESE